VIALQTGLAIRFMLNSVNLFVSYDAGHPCCIHTPVKFNAISSSFSQDDKMKNRKKRSEKEIQVVDSYSVHE